MKHLDRAVTHYNKAVRANNALTDLIAVGGGRADMVCVMKLMEEVSDESLRGLGQVIEALRS